MREQLRQAGDYLWNLAGLLRDPAQWWQLVTLALVLLLSWLVTRAARWSRACAVARTDWPNSVASRCSVSR